MHKAEEALTSQTNFPQLIPSHKKDERRLLSVLMASLDILPEFRGAFFKEVGYLSGKSCNYISHMEPQYNHSSLSNARPDGLAICTRGKNTWSAFIEAKANSQIIATEQIQSYTELAYKLGVNSVISISNTYPSSTIELPYSLPQSKRKKRDVYHLAWPQIRSILNVVINSGKLTKCEKQIAKQILRFFNNPEHGIITFDQMSIDWPKFVKAVDIGINIKNQKGFSEIVSDWQQERRDLFNKLSTKLDSAIKIKHAAGAKSTISEKTNLDKTLLNDQHLLTASYQILDANSVLEVSANIKAKTIRVELKINTPENKKAGATLSWLSKKIKPLNNAGYFLNIRWPNSRTDKILSLDDFLKLPSESGSRQTAKPKRISIFYLENDVRKFSSRKGFIEKLEATTNKILEDIKRCDLMKL